jgi:hypothetical protein
LTLWGWKEIEKSHGVVSRVSQNALVTHLDQHLCREWRLQGGLPSCPSYLPPLLPPVLSWNQKVARMCPAGTVGGDSDVRVGGERASTVTAGSSRFSSEGLGWRGEVWKQMAGSGQGDQGDRANREGWSRAKPGARA